MFWAASLATDKVVVFTVAFWVLSDTYFEICYGITVVTFCYYKATGVEVDTV
jgi:hypothetical protein